MHALVFSASVIRLLQKKNCWDTRSSKFGFSQVIPCKLLYDFWTAAGLLATRCLVSFLRACRRIRSCSNSPPIDSAENLAGWARPIANCSASRNGASRSRTGFPRLCGHSNAKRPKSNGRRSSGSTRSELKGIGDARETTGREMRPKEDVYPERLVAKESRDQERQSRSRLVSKQRKTGQNIHFAGHQQAVAGISA